MAEIIEFLQSLTDSSFIERGPRYDVYAQLRESNLQSKRLKLSDLEPVFEIPISENSPPLKKFDDFHGNLGGFEEDYQVSELPKFGFLRNSVKFEGNVQVYEVHKSEHSPILRRSGRNLGNLGGDGRASAIPKPGFLTRSMKFNEISTMNRENEQICEIPRSEYSPISKKSIKFQGETGQKQGYSVLAQSVPDLSSVLRKENRKPTPETGNVNRIPRGGKCGTPPASKTEKERVYGSVSKYGGGSKSVNSGEKQSKMKGIIGRKSCANIQELKGLSVVAATAINAENKRTRKSTLFSTKYF